MQNRHNVHLKCVELTETHTLKVIELSSQSKG